MIETCSEEKTKQESGRDNKGRFIKGKSGNPGGRSAYIDLIVAALEKESKRQGFKSFADVVANRALTNETVLVAVLRKIVPDRLATEGEAAKFFNFIYAYRNSNPNSPVRTDERTNQSA